jgi:LCP family protein required for cell wall assembly
MSNRRTYDRMATRRAVSLLLMSLVLPGSAQLVAGDRRVGRVALRIWFLLVLLVLAGLALLLVDPGTALSLGVRRPVLLGLQAGLLAVGVGWFLVMADAWRLSHPRSLPGGRRVAVGALALVLAVGVSGPLLLGSRYAGVQRDLIGDVFAEGGDIETSPEGRLNVLLLGGDAGSNRIGVRPDSIVVASIDVSSGATVLFGLPRNMQDVAFPRGTLLAQEFPAGFPDLLNAVYTYGTANPELVPGAVDPGATATMLAVEGVLGIPVHYHVLVNLQGFEQLVDALGGVTIRVHAPIPIGGGSSPVVGYIEPGLQELDGFEALWYARSREGADDYARMARQRCVMGAVLREANPQTALLRFQQIAASTTQLVSTDLPQGGLPDFASLVPEVREAGVRSVQLVPPRFSPADPDIDLIHATVQEALARPPASADQEEPVDPAQPGGDPPEDGSGDAADTDRDDGHAQGDGDGGSSPPSAEGEPQDGEQAAIELERVCSYT